MPDTFVKTFPCAGCGARLTFAPGTKTLKCEHCGFTNEIAENDARSPLTLVVAFLVLFMKRSMAERGSHAGPG